MYRRNRCPPFVAVERHPRTAAVSAVSVKFKVHNWPSQAAPAPAPDPSPSSEQKFVAVRGLLGAVYPEDRYDLAR